MDLVEHAEEGGGGAVEDGAVEAAEARGLEGEAVEAAGSRETTHQRDVQARAPLDRHLRLERIERAPAHLLASLLLFLPPPNLRTRLVFLGNGKVICRLDTLTC